MSKKNKAFLIIDLAGEIGGAQKRNIALCKYLLNQRDDIYILINDRLFENYKEHGLISDHKNIRVLKLSKSAKKGEHVTDSKTSKREEGAIRKYPKYLLWIVKRKQFIGILIKWIIFCFEFGKIVTSNKINTVYAIWTGGMWSWPVKKIFRFRLIYGYNDADLTWLSKRLLNIFDSEYWVMKHCDKIDFLSESIKCKFNNDIFKIDPERVSISPCSFVIYDNYFPKYPKENNVVFLGRFIPERNIHLILRAINIYQDSGSYDENLNFYFIGDGREKSKVIEYIEDNKLRNIYLIGKSFYPWEYLRKSRIFITVATENYLSQSLLEAMACENSIIASDVGETRKLISSEEGVLVPLKPEKIAEAISYLVENPKECVRLGKNARIKAIENHNIEKYVKYFNSLVDCE